MAQEEISKHVLSKVDYSTVLGDATDGVNFNRYGVTDFPALNKKNKGLGSNSSRWSGPFVWDTFGSTLISSTDHQ
jgi:hypothetical protein